MSLVISVDTKHARAKFNHMIEKTANYTLVFEKERVYLATKFTENAVTQGSLVGGWRPEVAPGAFRGAEAIPAFLFRTGALMSSLENLRGEDANISPHSATFGTNVEYAKFHQYGTEKMPSRKIIFEPAGFAQKFADDVAKHIDPSKVSLKSLMEPS